MGIAGDICAHLGQAKNAARTPGPLSQNTLYDVEIAENGISCHLTFDFNPVQGTLQNATGAALVPLIINSYSQAARQMMPLPAPGSTVITYEIPNPLPPNLADRVDTEITAFVVAYQGRAGRANPLPQSILAVENKMLDLQSKLKYPGGSFRCGNSMRVSAQLMPGAPQGDEHHYQIFHLG